MSSPTGSSAPAAARATPLAEAKEPPLLWHLKVSHYNEKVRWALDYKGIPHYRRAVIPGDHVKIAERLTGGSTFPIIEIEGRPVGDSTQIIEELERRQPEPPLYPDDPLERRRALEIEDFLDEQLGPYTRRLIVHSLLPDPNLFLDTFVPGGRGFRRRMARAMFPVIRRRLVLQFELDELSIELAREKCRKAGARFAAELGPSGYLVGDRFTVADLTAAALVAPPIAPVQFPYPQPQRGHPLLSDVRGLLDEFGLADWAREMYARHRGRSSQLPAPM